MGYLHAKLRGYAVHDAADRVLLMELHVGVSVTVLTPGDDAPRWKPGRGNSVSGNLPELSYERIDVLKAVSATKVAGKKEQRMLPWLNALPLHPRLPNTDLVSSSKFNFEKTSMM